MINLNMIHVYLCIRSFVQLEQRQRRSELRESPSNDGLRQESVEHRDRSSLTASLNASGANRTFLGFARRRKKTTEKAEAASQNRSDRKKPGRDGALTPTAPLTKQPV